MDPSTYRSKWIEFIMIVGIFILGFHMTNSASTKAHVDVCQSEACKNIAASILHKMNQSVNPCDDFYEFACGNYTRNSVISPTTPQNDAINRLRDVVQNQLRNNIENEISEKDPEAFQKLLTYYKTCMDEDQIEKYSIKEFLEILNELGGWPVLLGKSYREGDKFDCIENADNISKVGYSCNDYVLKATISNDLKNSSKNVIYLEQPTFDISQEYLSQGFENVVVKAYFKYMVDVAEILGADREQAKLELGESLNFEIDLAKISLSTSERRDMEQLYNPMKISDLQSKYPYIPWLRYLNNLMSPFQRLTEDEVVVVEILSYLDSLGNLLARTPKRVLTNYMMWRFVQSSATQLNQKVSDAHRKFRASITGNRNKNLRWQTCVRFASTDMHVATSALYVRRNFDKASKDEAIDLVEHLRQSFKGILLEVDWMDETTRSAALQKLEQIIPLVGYFDESLDDTKINDYYRDLKLDPKSFLKTVRNCKRFDYVKLIKKFRDPILRIDWTDSYYASDVTNAFYSPSSNAIQFPASVLQGDLYNKGYPKYVNYASIGSVIGHEMTHGFDDQGCNFDGNGNMIDWWNADTKKEYLRRAKCVIDQYSNFVDPEVGLHLKGDLTQGENIADNGGLKEAYLAYSALEKKIGKESTLPGLEEFGPRQLFWISYSNYWCTKYRTEYLTNIITTDPHSPNRFRVIGSIINNPYFAKDFSCPAGSPMNPVKKCSVW